VIVGGESEETKSI